MRVELLQRTMGPDQAAAQQAWADYLLTIGEGRSCLPDSMLMQVPEDMVVPGERKADLVRDVFGDLEHDPDCRRPRELIKRCILSPKNDDVMDLNQEVGSLMPGEVSNMHGSGPVGLVEV